MLMVLSALLVTMVPRMVSPLRSISQRVSEGRSPVHFMSAEVLLPLRLKLLILQLPCWPCSIAAWSGSVAGRHISRVRSGMEKFFACMVTFARHFTPGVFSAAGAPTKTRQPVTATRPRTLCIGFIAAPPGLKDGRIVGRRCGDACEARRSARMPPMATGWAREGAVQEQIDA